MKKFFVLVVAVFAAACSQKAAEFRLLSRGDTMPVGFNSATTTELRTFAHQQHVDLLIVAEGSVVGQYAILEHDGGTVRFGHIPDDPSRDTGGVRYLVVRR